MFLRKDVLKICSKFTGEQQCRSVISIKLLWKFTETDGCLHFLMADPVYIVITIKINMFIPVSRF